MDSSERSGISWLIDAAKHSLASASEGHARGLATRECYGSGRPLFLADVWQVLTTDMTR